MISWRFVLFLAALIVGLGLFGLFDMIVGEHLMPIAETHTGETSETAETLSWTSLFWGLVPVVIVGAAVLYLVGSSVAEKGRVR